MVAEKDLDRLADELAARIARRLSLGADARPFYTPKTLARRLAVSERMVRDLIGGPHPAIKSYRVGGARRIAPEDLEDYLRRQRTT